MAVTKSGNDRDSSDALLGKAEEIKQSGTQAARSIGLEASPANAEVVRDRRALKRVRRLQTTETTASISVDISCKLDEQHYQPALAVGPILF